MKRPTWERLLESRSPAATILIRIAVGVVFLSEGIQKFLYADALGAGRFTKIGIPAPEVMGPFVGLMETVGGVMLFVGLLTRLAAVPLVIDMLVAIASTKIPILIGHGYLMFAKPSGSKFGFWSTLHEARTDLSMLLCLVFLLIVGGGYYSLDSMIFQRKSRSRQKQQQLSMNAAHSAEAATADATRKARTRPGDVVEVARVFLRLGCLSFGGPVAHLGYFRAEVVQKRKWIDDAQYGDLVALCQFLPGPASSQVVFALGMIRSGIVGAFVASLCFTLPSAILMIAFARGVALVGDLHQVGWLHGLKLAAVGVLAQAAWGMGKKLCPDRTRASLCLAAAAVLLLNSSASAQVGVIALGGFVG